MFNKSKRTNPNFARIAVTKQCDLICHRLVANQPPNFLLIHLLLLAPACLDGWYSCSSSRSRMYRLCLIYIIFPAVTIAAISWLQTVCRSSANTWSINNPFGFGVLLSVSSRDHFYLSFFLRFLLAGTSACTQNLIFFIFLMSY